MSEAPKVEEPVVATPVETSPAVETAAVVEPVVEEPVAEHAAEVAEEPATEAAAVEEDVKPVEEGVLGYKGPGLLKSLIFQKKFFWFGTEPVEHKNLSSYLRGEKLQEVANKNAAWAAHTGKGLMFFSKKLGDKTPHGLFNLSEISEVSEEGTIAFFFTLGGHKHTFETTTSAGRDNWVATLKAKAAEAKDLATTVVDTEEYKKALTELTPVAAAPASKKSVEKDSKAEETKEEKADEKKDRKSRSVSRSKRNSLFGGFGLGKKEEKTEVAAEDAPVVAATEESAEAAAVPEIIETAPAAEPVEKPAKRNSIFGTLKSQWSTKTEKKSDDSPATPVKDAEPVSENAPVIPAVEASEPITSVETSVPVEVTEAPVTNGESKIETPTVKSDKRKASLPFFGKKSAPTSEDETDKPAEKPFFARIRDTVNKKKSPKAAADKPVEPTAGEASAVEDAPAVVEPAVASEPNAALPAATAQVAASA